MRALDVEIHPGRVGDAGRRCGGNVVVVEPHRLIRDGQSGGIVTRRTESRFDVARIFSRIDQSAGWPAGNSYGIA